MSFSKTVCSILLLSVVFSSCQNRVTKKNAFVYFEKTACFGNCPIYKFTLKHNGEATFEGIRFVKDLGKFKYTFSKDEVESVFTLLNTGDWDNFKEEYPTNYSDLPSKIIEFRYKKVSKRVKVSGEHPVIIDSFFMKLEKLVEKAEWESTIYE